MRTTHSIIWLLLLPAVVTSGCREACTSDELRYGDKCIPRPDAGREEADAAGSRIEPDDTSVGDAAGGDDTEGGTENQPDDHECDADSGIPCTIDPCSPNPCAHGVCSGSASGFKCTCEAGWIGDGICDKNTNPRLDSLLPSVGKLHPTFSPAIHEYSVDVGIGEPEISLLPVPAVPDGVAITIDGNAHRTGDETDVYSLPLNQPKKTTIEVSSSSGETASYTVTFRRTVVLQAKIPNPRAGSTSFGMMSLLPYVGRGLALHDKLLAAVTEGPEENTGNVVLFTRSSSSTWTRNGYIGRSTGRARYGAAIVLTDDWLAIGAPGTPASDEGSANEIPGQVSIFQRTLLPNRAEEIYISPLGDSLEFGHSIAARGDTLAVLSARQLHVYELRDGVWQAVSHFDVAGYAVAVLGETIAVSEQARGTRLYHRVQGSWQAGKVISTFSENDIGGALASSENGIAVTTTYACFLSCAGQEPALRLYEPLGNEWAMNRIGPAFGASVPPGLDPNGFGADLAWWGRLAVVGAPLENSRRSGIRGVLENIDGLKLEGGSLGPGAAYFFVQGSTGWKLDAIAGPVIENEPANLAATGFGSAIVIDNGLVAIAANAPEGQSGSTSGAGAIYVFGPDCSVVPPDAEVPGC